MEVVTFLTKIQKSEGNSTTLKNWIQKLEGKPTTLKNWIQKMEGNSTTPKNCVLTKFLNERSTIFFLVFSLIRFWIFVRNAVCPACFIKLPYHQWPYCFCRNIFWLIFIQHLLNVLIRSNIIIIFAICHLLSMQIAKTFHGYLKRNLAYIRI